MKEFIVIIATVLLGIVLAGFVLDLGDKAESLSEGVSTKIEGAFSDIEFGETA